MMNKVELYLLNLGGYDDWIDLFIIIKIYILILVGVHCSDKTITQWYCKKKLINYLKDNIAELEYFKY
jgi:hypothetical protein